MPVKTSRVVWGLWSYLKRDPTNQKSDRERLKKIQVERYELEMSVDRLDRTRVDTTPLAKCHPSHQKSSRARKYSKSELYSLLTCQTEFISKSTNVEAEELWNLLETFIEKRNL